MIFLWKTSILHRVDDSNTIYPLVNKQFAIEHGRLQFFCFTHKNMVIFNSYVNVYQRESYKNNS